jgi:TolA-binding protein
VTDPADRTPMCPDEETLARAFERETEPALLAHIRGCPACRGQWQADSQLRQLGQMLPHERPDPQRRQRVRAELLARLPLARSPRRQAGWVLAAATAGLALLIFGRTAPPSVDPRTNPLTREPPAGPAATALLPSRVEASAGARFFMEAGPPHEVVRLQEGTLRITVERLADGERSFRVVAPDAEVQVRGTVFEATVVSDHLVAVRVERGRVSVRPTGQPAVELAAGAHWRAPTAPPAAAAPPPPPTRSRTAVDRRTPAERTFDLGLRALGAGDPAAAGTAFARAAALAGQTPIAEEASYWTAVSQLRAGNRSGARAALDAFLARFPGSPRAGESSVMLGWLLLEAGDKAGARARFQAAQSDPSPRIRRAAAEALDSIRP